jgi:hypothetical protein
MPVRVPMEEGGLGHDTQLQESQWNDEQIMAVEDLVSEVNAGDRVRLFASADHGWRDGLRRSVDVGGKRAESKRRARNIRRHTATQATEELTI